jgi:Fe-S-cluster containining protein
MTGPCADCTRGCCRKYLVTVTGYDMWVIANGLNLAPEQFIVTVPQKTPTGRGFLLDPSSSTTYDIALDKQRVEGVRGPEGTPLIDKPCVFWIELHGGIGRCGIYPLRPYVCQTYPGTFVDSTQVVRREDVLCPDDAWRDGALQRPIWRERVLRMFVEHEIYGLAASRWNYHVQHAPMPDRISPPGYYAFLMSYYRRLEPVRASLTPAEWLDMCDQWCECLREGRSPIERDYDRMKPWTAIMDEICAIASDFFPDDLPLSSYIGESIKQEA